jgi:hypothetical protein
MMNRYSKLNGEEEIVPNFIPSGGRDITTKILSKVPKSLNQEIVEPTATVVNHSFSK